MKTEIGHYVVNGKKFASKSMAILEAQLTQTDVEWYFFDEIFSKVKWQIEPEASLKDLYVQRAKQIREAYDYVVVFCSGGADSNNVIRTFINNGIHVDEVVGIAPVAGLNRYNWNTVDRSVYNTMSETKFALFPLLDEISVRSPTTKITIDDSFESILALKPDEWIYESTGHLIGPNAAVFGKLEKFQHLKNLAESGKRIGVVWGIDKPVMRIRYNGEVRLIIPDFPISTPRQPFKFPYPNVDRVLFYYTHEMPELMVKQAHVVMKALRLRENIALRNLVTGPEPTVDIAASDPLDYILNPTHKPTPPSDKDKWQRGIVPFIYPDTYTKDLFQCTKLEPGNGFFPKHNNWLLELHGQEKMAQMFKSDFSSFYKNLNPKYLNPQKTGFIRFTKIFVIGNINAL